MIAQQFFEVVKAALRAIEVNTEKVYDISFASGQVGSLLADVVYSGTIERVFAAGKSTMKILKYLNSLNSSLLKKTPWADADTREPVELYARRAIFAASNSRSLMVGTKYR